MALQQGLSQEEFQRIKTRAQEIINKQHKVKSMYEDLADMYWISETDESGNLTNSSRTIRYNQSAFDDNDIRLTATTSSRDRVVGLHRMLRTSKPRFSVECKNKTYADRIEEALDDWWDASNEYKRATLESELALSGILFSDENLSVVAVDDLLAGDNVKPVRKHRLEELRRKTPIRFDVDSPLVAYPVMGDLGKGEHLTKKEITGRQLKSEWGVVDAKDDQTYYLYDYWDLEFVCTWFDQDGTGNSKGMDYLRGGEHGLFDIPIFTTTTDGTDLFFEEERKRQPFLYAVWKSGLHKREDEMLTALFTSMFARGMGPLVVLDKSAPGYDVTEIETFYQGLTRIMAAPGKPQMVDDKAFDANLLQLANLTQTLGERATIASQTLGENIEPGVPYSGFALASQNGRIPLIPIQEATEKVIHDACMYALRYFKETGMEWEGLKGSEILDDFELTVSLEVDLPQDKVRTAQFLSQLKQAGVPLSNEWIHNELQIKDSNQMTHDVMAEMAEQAAYQQNMPQLIQALSGMFQQMQQQGGPPQPGPQEGAYPQAPGGPEMVQAGGEVAPATEPMPPEQAQQNRGVA